MLHNVGIANQRRVTTSKNQRERSRGEDRCQDRKSTRLNSSHGYISYAVFCLKKKIRRKFSERPMNRGNIFCYLQRRNAYKVALAHIVADWDLAQGITQLLATFEIPNSAKHLI